MGIETMGSYGMRSARVHGERRYSSGFTLIASLLMLLLLSGIAIGLLMMTNTEGKVGGTDLQNNLAFHAAEGGIEKMASDLSATFTNAQSPNATEICAVSGSSYQPVMTGVTWTQYSVTTPKMANSASRSILSTMAPAWTLSKTSKVCFCSRI